MPSLHSPVVAAASVSACLHVRSHRAAFTLIEILLVASLIVFLVAGFGAGLRENTGQSLGTAQILVASLVDQARLVATSRQTESRLVVDTTSPPAGEPGKFLRMFQVLHAEPAGSTNWIPVGPPVYLPRGICLVPPATLGLPVSVVGWPGGLASSPGLRRESLAISSHGPVSAAGRTSLFLGFRANGSVDSDIGDGLKLVVAPISGPPDRLRFTKPETARVVWVQAGGAVTLRTGAARF